jgi:uncharacterized protein YcaQ
MSTDVLSLGEARRIALAAQGFDRGRPRGRVGVSEVGRVLKQLGLVQIDYVNVLAPAHYQVLFSRLGPYDQSDLHELVYRRREFTEQWAHEASIVPVETWPLLRHRMETHRVRPYGFEKFLVKNPEYVALVLEEVRIRGALTADDLAGPGGRDLRIPGAWHGSVPRAVLEAHFGRGLLAIADRRPNFARAYDLAERVLPGEHHGRVVKREEAQRELLLTAASACGIAAGTDLADYYRMPVREARPRLTELVEAGELREVKVEGWREPGYLHRSALLPKKLAARALLSPFDPVIWYRPRAARLFQFDYRVEIFVPQPKRKWGYYVLPFLLDDRLVARVDLRADRHARRLVVLSTHLESHAKPRAVAGPLAAELHLLADWLALDSVDVVRQGDLAPALASALLSSKNANR